MNTTTATETKQEAKPRRRAAGKLAQEVVSINDVLGWQALQLHAALRKRLMENDPRAVIMIDEMVNNLWMMRMIEQAPQDGWNRSISQQIADAQRLLSSPMSEDECIAAMQAQVQMRREDLSGV